jgi:hypothetical protein
VFATFNERNLFGDARDLRVQGQLGTRASNVFVSYRDRHFMDTDDILTVTAFYNRYRRPGYIEQALGTRVERSGMEWGDWEGAVAGRLEYIRLREASGIDAKEDLDTVVSGGDGALRRGERHELSAGAADGRPAAGRRGGDGVCGRAVAEVYG